MALLRLGGGTRLTGPSDAGTEVARVGAGLKGVKERVKVAVLMNSSARRNSQHSLSKRTSNSYNHHRHHLHHDNSSPRMWT